MPRLSSDWFLSALRDADLLTAERLAEIERDADDGLDPATLAMQLVRDGDLTDWQAMFLLSEREGLKVGNYVLQKCLNRGPLGDHMVAFHQRLGRPVDLHVLPREITERSSAFQSFLRQASNVARLDHPNLVHVYDIDQQLGRHYIVAERFDGRPIEQLTAAGTPLELVRVGSIARQLLDALVYAESHQASVGAITRTNILVSADGTGKIGNLATLALSRAFDPRRSTGSEAAPGEPDHEYQQLATILTELVERCAGQASREERASLVAILESIGVGGSAHASAASAALEHWLEVRKPPQSSVSLPEQSSVITNRTATSSPLTFSQPSTATARRKSGRTAVPWARIASMASLVILVCVLAWTYLRSTRESTRTSARRMEAEPAKATGKRDTSRPKPKASDSVPPGSNRRSRPAAQKAPQRPQPPSNISRELAALIDGVESAPQPRPVSPIDEPPVPNATPTQVKKPEIEPPDSSESVPQPAGEQPAKVPAADENSPETTNSPEAVKSGDQPAGAAAPFADTAGAVTIPQLRDRTEVILTQVHPSDQYLLACELIGNPELTRRTRFSLEKDPGEQSQTWTVSGQSGTSGLLQIASLSLVGSDLKFRWLNDGGRDPTFAYLRNCLLKLEIGDATKLVRLRRPQAIGEVKLTADEPAKTVEFEIVDFPFDSGAGIAEFIEIADVDLGEADKEFSFLIEPADQRVPSRESLFIYLTHGPDRFLFVDVQTKLGKQTRLSAALKIVQDPKPRNYSDRLFRDLDEFLKTAAAHVGNTLQQASAYDPPYGEKTKHEKLVKELTKQLEAAQRQVSDLADQKRRATAVFSRPLRFRVYYLLDENEVDLATWNGEPHVAN